MTFTPIANERLSDKVVSVIRKQIKEGLLKPGEKLPNELDLAEELGVSRGILREALTILQAEKYLCRKQKEGTFVNPEVRMLLQDPGVISLQKATCLDLLEMRECIEQRAVEKIIDSAGEEQIQDLFSLIAGRKTAEEETLTAEGFHYRIAELSGNILFVNFLDTYAQVMDSFIKTAGKQIRKEEAVSAEHRRIATAILARDRQQAKEAVAGHFFNLREWLKNSK